MGSQTSPASSGIYSSRLKIMMGFLSCRNASMNMQPPRGFSNGTGNYKTCLAEPDRVKSRGTKTCHINTTPKGSGEVIRTYPWGRGWGLRTSGTVRTGDVPTGCHHCCLIPSKTSTLWIRGKNRGIEAFRSLGSCYPHAYESWFPPVSNGSVQGDTKWARATSTNQHQKPVWPSACYHGTSGPEGPTNRSGSEGGWEASLCLSCLTLRGNEGNWKSDSIGCHHFQPLPPRMGFCTPSLPTTLAKLNTLLEAMKSNSPYILLLWPSVFENYLCCILCMYVDVMFQVEILLQT